MAIAGVRHHLEIMESIAKQIEDVRKLRVTRLSAAARAVKSTWVTYRPLLDGDSIGGPLQTLPENMEAKAQGAGTKTLITLVSKDTVAIGV